MSAQIQVARLVATDKPLEVGTADKPKPGPKDVLVRVAACSFVPNTKNVFTDGQGLPLQNLPAIVGLDVSGVIEAVGDQVLNLKAGQRVYVNPLLTCETCHHCRSGRADLCPSGCLRGYFAMYEQGRDLLNMHPYGGLSQYVVSPDSKIALLPDSFDLHSAARLGYAGTSYAALKKAGVQPGSTVLINGVTGTLGVSAVAIALGLGATKVLGIGRNPERLEDVEALSPKGTERVAVFRSTEGNTDDDAAKWVKEQTAGLGVDAYIDCLGVGGAASTTETLVRSAVKVGGRAVLVAGGAQGDIKQPYYEFFMRDVALVGSVWFTNAEIDELIALVGAGVVDLSWLENQTFPLDKVNEALDAASDRPGGFVNVVVIPDGAPKKD